MQLTWSLWELPQAQILIPAGRRDDPLTPLPRTGSSDTGVNLFY